jgi:peptide/nickel transport system permease protein
MGFVVRRLAHAFLVFVGVSLLTFLLLELAPGDFFNDLLLNLQTSPETVAAMRAQYGLDRSLPVRYGMWLRSVATGEWGYSFAYHLPVFPLLWARAKNTLLLTVVAGLLAWSVAVPLGVWTAEHRGRWLDRLISGLSSSLLALPELLLALACLVLAVRTRMFPLGGMVSLDYAGLGAAAKIRDLAIHMALPVLVLVLGAVPVFLRHVRAGMIEALAQPFVQSARGHGISRRTILYRYALPAAANPLISLLGLSLATLLSGSLLVEVIMSWPGLGPLLMEAILGRDIYVVIGTVMLSTVFLVLGNFVADVLLYAVDPRIRTEST